MTLAPEAVRSMFDRIAPVYDAMNRVMTAGLDLRWRRLAAADGRPARRPRPRRSLRDRRLRGRRPCARARSSVTGLDFSPRMLERARRKAPGLEWVEGDMLALPFDDGSFDAATVGFGVRNVSDLERALRELRRVLRPGGQARDPRDHACPGRARAVLRRSGSTGSCRLLGRLLPGGCRVLATCRPRSRGSRAPRSSRRCSSAPGFSEVRFRLLAGSIIALHTRARVPRVRTRCASPSMPRPGLAAYMAELEARLAQAVGRREGYASVVASEALAAGGKRLRPLLCFLSIGGAESEVLLAAGVATELVHMATLVHDDLVDGARMRRGVPSAWSVFGPERGALRRRLPVRLRVRRAGRRGGLPRGRDPGRRLPRARARRGDAAARRRGARRRRSTTTSSGARSRPGSSSRPRAASARAATRSSAPTASRSGSPSRSPTTSSTAPARPRRPGRSPAPTCARGRRRCRSCSPRRRTRSCAARSPAGRSRARSSGWRAPTRSPARARPRSTTPPRRAPASARRVHREELEALTYAVVDRGAS